MEFTLSYRGPLKANGGATDKHRLREVFHPQLKVLWTQPPLKNFHEKLVTRTPEEYALSVIRVVGPFTFAPLVSRSTKLVAELNITMLRPGPPGDIVHQGGDIDNRLKTLLDALSMAREPGALPKHAAPAADQAPFYCLLEDDSLISGFSVRTDRLLEPATSSSEVLLLIRVVTRQLETMVGTIGLG